MPLAAVLLLNACHEPSSESDLLPDDQPLEFTFNLNGEILFSDTPLNGRVESASEPAYYFVQVTDTEGGTHASGIFDHIPSDLSLILFPGRVYNLSLKAIRNGETFGLWKVNDTTLYIDFQNRYITNEFRYNTSLSFANTNNRYIRYYHTSDSSSFRQTSGSTGVSNPLDIYYGVSTVDVDAAADTTISIDLARNVFGYEVVVSGLTFGYLDVSVAGQFKRYEVDGDSTESRVLSFGFNSESTDFYTRNMSVVVTHRDTIEGIAVSTPVFSQSVPFKRLHQKNIWINAPVDTASGDQNGNFGFQLNFEDIPMAEGDTLQID